MGLSIQEVGLRNSLPRFANRARLDARELGVHSVMDSVTVYLKNFDGGKVLVSKGVVYLEVGTEGSPFEVEVLGLVKSNRTTSNGYIHSTEATHESISCGGLQYAQEPGDYIGEYVNVKWERKGG